MGKYLDQLDQRIKLTDNKKYTREQYQSFMTGPEWRNVEMAEEFAANLREGKSMFQFPYFRQIFDLWKVVYNSYAAARKYNSMSEVLFSEYMVMDIFVAFFTTIEFIPKGIISLLLYPFLAKENNTSMQRHLADYFSKYAADLQTIPFYDHTYGEVRANLAKQYEQCNDKSWVDWFTWKAVSIELWARHWISKPLHNWFNQEGNTTPASTDILVKFNALDAATPEDAKKLFREKLALVTEEHQVTLVDEHLYAKEKPKTKNDSSYISVYARLRAPRYASFQAAVYALAKQSIELRKIAGQERVQVKCIIDAADQDSMMVKENALNRTEKAVKLYSYTDHIHSNHKICLFDVPVRKLHETLDSMTKKDGVKVNFVHNF